MINPEAKLIGILLINKSNIKDKRYGIFLILDSLPLPMDHRQA
jgi:hypothetical protein